MTDKKGQPVPNLRHGAAKAVKKSDRAHSKRRRIEAKRQEHKAKPWKAR